MGRSGIGAGGGTGQPLFFRCHALRRSYAHRLGLDARAKHVVTLTGRKKHVGYPNGVGARRVDEWRREYRCSCGHVGWSTHIDLRDMEARGRSA